MRFISLTNSNRRVTIDDSDHDLVSTYSTWQCNKAGGGITHCTSFGSKESSTTVSMSRMIMNAPRGILVDHKDGNIFNMRRSNLRFATKVQNAQNCRKQRTPTSSKFKGVSWDKQRKRWKAYINFLVNGNTWQKFLGRFDTERKAAKAYNAAASKLFGEFARPNPV